MVRVHAVPAFRDNYIWLMVGAGGPPPVVLVDPGAAAPIIEALRHKDLSPTALFIPPRHGDHNTQPGLPLFAVLDVPGHTAGHIAHSAAVLLFCGDTLFAGGCGRLFEGT